MYIDVVMCWSRFAHVIYIVHRCWSDWRLFYAFIVCVCVKQWKTEWRRIFFLCKFSLLITWCCCCCLYSAVFTILICRLYQVLALGLLTVPERGVVRVTWPRLKFYTPWNVFGTAKATVFTFSAPFGPWSISLVTTNWCKFCCWAHIAN